MSAALIQNRRVISSSSLVSSSALIITASRAMPQIGQLPGSSRSTSGCIGQVYWCLGAAMLARSSAMPHFGQAPGWLAWTSGCIGQVHSVLIFLLLAARAISGNPVVRRHRSVRQDPGVSSPSPAFRRFSRAVRPRARAPLF